MSETFGGKRWQPSRNGRYITYYSQVRLSAGVRGFCCRVCGYKPEHNRIADPLKFSPPQVATARQRLFTSNSVVRVRLTQYKMPNKFFGGHKRDWHSLSGDVLEFAVISYSLHVVIAITFTGLFGLVLFLIKLSPPGE